MMRSWTPTRDCAVTLGKPQLDQEGVERIEILDTGHRRRRGSGSRAGCRRSLLPNRASSARDAGLRGAWDGCIARSSAAVPHDATRSPRPASPSTSRRPGAAGAAPPAPWHPCRDRLRDLIRRQRLQEDVPNFVQDVLPNLVVVFEGEAGYVQSGSSLRPTQSNALGRPK